MITQETFDLEQLEIDVVRTEADLYKISQQYEATLQEIQAINNLPSGLDRAMEGARLQSLTVVLRYLEIEQKLATTEANRCRELMHRAEAEFKFGEDLLRLAELEDQIKQG